MNPLYMIQCTIEPKAFMAFAREQGLDSGRGELDLGYIGHAWLKAAFGGLAPGRWRLFMPGPMQRQSMPARILAYSDHPAEALVDQLARFGPPSVEAVCSTGAIQGKILPQEWPTNRNYAFEALCCPVGRKARQGTEKDVFLLAAEQLPEERLERGQVYQDWFKTRAEAVEGIQILKVDVSAFRLVKVMRKTQDNPRKPRQAVRPQAEFRGILRANGDHGLLALLRQGVGRHRAFGFGMILLRPT